MSTNLIKGLTILYAEDEEPIRVLVEKRLKRVCENVLVGADGEEGLELFKKNRVDIIVTDISMPKMDGLSMISKIKEINSDIPIILTTAHSDEEHFLDSIEIGVDKYIIKPIKFDALINALEKLAQLVRDRELAKEYEKKIIEDRVNEATKDITKKLLDASPNPTFVILNREIKFFNRAFAQILESELLELVSKDITKLDEIIFKKGGYLDSFDNLDDDISTNIISIKQNRGRKIYKVTPKNIKIGSEDATLFTLNDITLLEYQKLKIENYSSLLEGYIFDVKYKKREITTEDKKLPLEERIEESTQEDKREKFSLSGESMAILRRSHEHKTSAKEYVDEIGEETIEQIQELEELENELFDYIQTLQESNDVTIITLIEQKLSRIGAVFNILIEFRDLAYAIEQLVELFRDIDRSTFDEVKIKKISIYLKAIVEEVKSWRETIFVNQDAIDIHYLDASFFSSCLQVELELNNKSSKIEQEDEDDDLILF